LTEHPIAPGLAPGLLKYGKDTVRIDSDGKVLVQLAFDADFRVAITSSVIELGARLTSPNQLRPEILPLWIAPSQLPAVAAIPGVRAITVPPPPVVNKNPVPIEAAAPMQFNLLPAGDNGSGITIGVISSSYNVCSGCTDTAATDVAAGELPGPGNPNGDTTPVVVLSDDTFGSDEGRAVLQIIYGLAPKAKLCFATAAVSEDAFAQAISNLQDPAQGCGANIIMDDIEYFDEPFFSDGAVAQAVDAVSAKGVTYVSSEGNTGPALVDGTFDPISDASARAKDNGSNLKLSGVPASLTAGGFYNFGTSGLPNIALPLTSYYSGLEDLILQWDDPFVAKKITANYNLLVFDSQGNYLADDSGIDPTSDSGVPVQFAQAAPGYQIAITLSNQPSGDFSQHVRVISSYQFFNSTNPNFPSIYGHPAAATALGTSAYYYGNLNVPEYFVSLVPFTDVFDDSGNRLTTPVVRQQPAIAGVDGIDTSFFPEGGSDTDSDGFPNFYGTSAAAATVAAEAAIVLQSLGGPSKVAPAAVRAAILDGAAGTSWDNAVGFGLASVDQALSPPSGAVTALNVSPSSLSVGQSVTLKATVTGSSGTPSGNVTLSAAGVVLATVALNGSGVASLTATSNGDLPGTYPIIATYNGNTTYSSSASPTVNVTLSKAPTALTLTASPTSVTPPAAVTLTATVKRSASGATGTPTGSVTFSTGGVTLATVKLNASGVAKLTAPSSGYPAGSYPIKAVYAGDLSDSDSTSSTVTVTVK
jgi:hypothetical protein